MSNLTGQSVLAHTRRPRDRRGDYAKGQLGAPLSRRSIQRVLSELARRAKISRLRVSAHTTRHTFALAFLKRHPGKLVELAALLGHESLDTTAIYTQPSQEEMADDLETSGLNADR